MMRCSITANRWSKTANLVLCLCVLCFVLQMVSCSRTPEGAQIISFASGVEERLPKDLKNAFIHYWAARARLDWNTIYEMEAPHLRWRYTKEAFLDRYGRAPKPVSVQVTCITMAHDQVADVSITCVFPDKRTGKEETLYPRDRWLKVGGTWYHIWKLPIFDNFL